jgi:hypothetical protein
VGEGFVRAAEVVLVELAYPVMHARYLGLLRADVGEPSRATLEHGRVTSPIAGHLEHALEILGGVFETRIALERSSEQTHGAIVFAQVVRNDARGFVIELGCFAIVYGAIRARFDERRDARVILLGL